MMQVALKLLQSKAGKLAGLVVLIVILMIVRLVVFRGTSLYPLVYWVILVALLVIGFVIWQLIKSRRTRKANDTMAAVLIANAQEAEASASPDRRAAYQRIRRDLEFAIRLLQKNCPKEFKSAPLYRLPWVMVVGPPADGKTTSIKNAGIRWPHQPRFDETGGGMADALQVEGSGGTRSCNWFFGTEAIILDTAGRWQARDQGQVDEREWLEFLRMLVKNRPRRPINGVVALVSIERILAGQDEAYQWAQKVRRQINEIMENLGTHVPVYFIFNKCDLIHGFVEFFSDLDRTGRKQIWGFTRRYNPRLRKSGSGLESEREEVLRDYDSEMERLLDVLDRRRLQRLAHPELNSAQRAALCVFPGEFRQLRKPIRQFLSDVFYDNPYGHNPVLRGVYYSSATQEGNPIVALMQQVAGDYDIPVEMLPLPARQTVDTYFLSDLLHNVVFKDGHLGGRFKKSAFDRNRLLLAGGLGVATLLVAGWMTASYFVNSGKNDHLQHIVQKTQAIQTPVYDDDATINALIALDSLRLVHDEYTSPGWPFGVFYWSFGRGRSAELAQLADSVLGRKTEAVFVDRAWNECEYVLRGTAYGQLNDYIAAYKSYLYLGREENWRQVDTGTVADHVMRRLFRSVTDDQLRLAYHAKLVNLLGYYNRLDNRQEYSCDANVRRAAEDQIRRAWDWEEVLDGIAERYALISRPFTASAFGPSFAGDATVPAAFTSGAWRDQVRDNLDSTLAAVRTDAVLNPIIGDQIAASASNPLYSVYVTRCQEVWDQFFIRLRLEQGAPDAIAFFFEMSGASSPLRRLLEDAAGQTQFTEDKLRSFFFPLHQLTGMIPLSAREQAAQQATGQQSAQMAPLTTYLQSLTGLTRPVEAMQVAASECSQSYKESMASIGNLKRGTQANLGGSSLARSLTTLLEQPFDIASAETGRLACNCLNNKWRGTVFNEFQKIREGFPFAANRTDALASEVETFFGPDGPLQTFHDQEMSGIRGSGLRAGGEYETARERVRKIRNMLDPNRPAFRLRFSNAAWARNLHKLIVRDQNGLVGEFDAGPAQTMDLNLGPGSWLEISVQTSQRYLDPIRFEGDWAALRMLEQSRITGNTGSLTQSDFTIEYTIESSYGNPLSLFRNFQLPRQVCQ